MFSLWCPSGLQYRIILMMFSGLLSACATSIPDHIKNSPTENLRLVQVQKEPEKHLGKIIRWGGSIISSKNEQNRTTLIILAQTLSKYGEPQQGDQSYGRFIARINGFLDPAIYSKGRAITVYGKFEKLQKEKIDHYEYHYPLVTAEEIYLWEIPEKYDYYDYPYWYDPWYPMHPPYWHRQ